MTDNQLLAAGDQRPTPNNQSGQVLVIAAIAMVAMVGVMAFVLQIAQLLSGLNAVADAAQYAAQVAARPSADSVVEGDVVIDEAMAVAIAQSQMQTALQQLAVADLGQSVTDTQVEVLNPPLGNCQIFTDDTPCYYTPAVRVTVPVTLRLLGFTFHTTRQGIATTATSSGTGAETSDLNPIEMPTPVVWPTAVFVK